MQAIWRACRCQSGATAIEFAIICVPLIFLSLGIIEFGRALNTRNDLAFAADAGTRKVLLGEASDVVIEDAIRAAFGAGQANSDTLTVSVGSETVDGAEFRTLALNYSFTLLIPGLTDDPIGLSLARRIPVQ